MVLGGQAASVLVALITEICFARLLGPAARGQISLCTMAVYLSVLVGGLGADIPIVIWVADGKRKMSQWLSAILLCGLTGCAAVILLWQLVYSHWHSSLLQGVTPSLFLIVLLTIPVAILFDYGIAVLTGAERFRQRAGVAVLDGVLSLFGFLALSVVAGRSAGAAMWGNLLGLVIGLGTCGLLLKPELANRLEKPAAGARLKAGLLAGLRGQIGNVAAFFNYRLDVFIVNYFLNPAHVGIYAVGVAVSEALWQIPQAAATALFPRTARTLDQGAAEFTCRIMRHVLLISCISALLLAMVSPFAVPLVFGARFAASVSVIWWILPGTVALALGKVVSSDLAGRHKTGYASAFGIVALCVTIALDLVLIPRLGIRGAAMASSAAYIVNAVLLLLALRRELRVEWAALLIPSASEFAQYKQLWTRTLMWLSTRRDLTWNVRRR
jgi:O-antigen/teichoic acid export membrane protein